MIDGRVREAERRWRRTGENSDLQRYLHELERRGASELELRAVRGRWGEPAQFEAADVLAALDRGAEAYELPILDHGYTYLAAVRLSAFRDLTRWALVFEHLGYFNRSEPGAASISLQRVVYENVSPSVIEPEWIYPVDDAPSGPLAIVESETGLEVSPEAREVSVRGQLVAIPRTPEEYAALRVSLQRPDQPQLFELLRALVAEHRDLLLATADERVRFLPADLPLFLTLDAWRHPDLTMGEQPSACEAFRMLAEALVRGEPEHYRPTEAPNTHWQYWPTGGTL